MVLIVGVALCIFVCVGTPNIDVGGVKRIVSVVTIVGGSIVL